MAIAWWYSVIPLGKLVIKNNRHVLFEPLRDFAPRGIGFRANIHADFKAGLRLRFRHQVFDQLHAAEHNALTRACQVGKQAMLNRVVLGRVRRVVRDSHRHTDVLHDLRKVRFKQVRACAMAPASVTEQQH